MEPAEYHRLAAVEDRMWYFRSLHRHIGRELDRHPTPGKPMRVLDAGCGTGGLIRRLQRPGQWEWQGIDISPVAVQLARPRVPRSVPLGEGSINALPFAPTAFDAVVCADVLYHVQDDGSALAEFHRVLTERGLLVLNVPAYPWLWSYHDVAVSGVRRYRRAALAQQVEQAGFRVLNWTHWNALVLPLIVFRRKVLPSPRSGSDVRPPSAWADRLMSGVMAIEHAWLGRGKRWRWGSSLLLVAQKTT